MVVPVVSSNTQKVRKSRSAYRVNNTKKITGISSIINTDNNIADKYELLLFSRCQKYFTT